MKIFSRVLIVVGLLTALGCGSYAFGRYVLSARLFGKSVVPSSGSDLTIARTEVSPPVTRKSHTHGDKPEVDVEVMPADEAGPGPEPPSLDSLQRDASSSTPRPTEAPTQAEPTEPQPAKINGDNGDSRAVGDETGVYKEGRKKHRKRKKKAETAVVTDTARAETGVNSVSAGAGTDSTPNPGSDSPVPAVEGRTVTSGGAEVDSVPRPTSRHRERHHSSKPTVTRRVHGGDSASTGSHNNNSSSPVPRPEGNSGGDSPIPMPG